MDIFDKFLKKYSYKFDKGYPDMNNSQDVLLLESILKSLNIPLNEIKLSPTELSKSYPPRHELSGEYENRGERFLEKINNGDEFEMNDGSTVVIDKEQSQEGINLLKQGDYKSLGGRNKYFTDTNGKEYSLSEFKKTPEFGSGAGSGGGSVNTSIQESSQSVVNAISYNIKQSLISEEDLTKDNIEQALNFCDVSNSLEEITEFILTQKTWVNTFIETSNLLFKNYPNSNFEQHRGSSFVDKIYNSFKIGKKEAGKSLNNDKWNPADIWMVDKSILNMDFPTNLSELNGTLANLFADNLLIGVSLKKIGKSAKISIYNINEEEKEGYEYVGYETRPTNNSVIIEYSDGKITFRTFNFATNFAGEIKGKTAAHGKIGQGPINDVLSQNNLPTLLPPKTIQENINNKNKEFYQDYYNIYNKILENINSEDFNEYMREKDMNYLVSKYLSLKLTSIIQEQDKKVQDEVISDIIRYASSSTKSSSVFVKIS